MNAKNTGKRTLQSSLDAAKKHHLKAQEQTAPEEKFRLLAKTRRNLRFALFDLNAELRQAKALKNASRNPTPAPASAPAGADKPAA